VRNAKEYGPICAQNPYFVPNAKEISREDCLYLNVFTPVWPAGHVRKPVMVWIPGGGNFAGGAGNKFDGEKLMQRDVVVVTLNYRVGIFGFFSHPELTRESSHNASGNQGFLDQIAALHWVQENIAKFGGDPANVTIFGESAGSFNVSALTTSPLARGLFRRMIGESGAVVLAGEPLSLAEAEKLGVSRSSTWGKGASPSLEALRAVTAADILKAEPNFLRKPPINLGLTVDGYVFPKKPAAVFAEGREDHVDMLLGNLAREWIPGVSPPADLTQAVEDTYPAESAKRALGLYAASGTDPLYGTPAEQWVEDIGFRCSGVEQLIWHSAARNRAFEYQFDHAPPFNFGGNTHSQDIAYVFGHLDDHGYNAADHAISEVMQRYWTNFTKTGDPNGPGLPKWPEFDAASRRYLSFGDEGPVSKEGLRRRFCDLFMENVKK
jgi:para-nitrobenzyl esterase